MANKAGTLRELGQSAEAIAICDNLMARFGSAIEMALREPVAMALLNKAAALGKLGKNTEAIAVCENIQAKFGSASGLPLSDIVVDAKSLRETIRGGLEAHLAPDPERS